MPTPADAGIVKIIALLTVVTALPPRDPSRRTVRNPESTESVATADPVKDVEVGAASTGMSITTSTEVVEVFELTGTFS